MNTSTNSNANSTQDLEQKYKQLQDELAQLQQKTRDIEKRAALLVEKVGIARTLSDIIDIKTYD